MCRWLSLLATAALLALAAVVASPLASQEPEAPEVYRRARTQLAVADTSAALASLRELTGAERDFAPGWGLLGRVLTAKASGVASDFLERREAEKALRRALELDSENPLYLFALAELMRKQQMYLDSRRVLGRAMEAMEKEPDRMPPAERAGLWFQRGLFYEDEYLDTRHLVYAPTLPISSDLAVPTFGLNFSDPEQFNEHLRHAAELSQFGEDDYERMAGAFRRALEADPTHSGAFRRLAIHLIDRGDLTGALELAGRYREEVPESPWGYITLGLVHQRLGRDSLAEVEFDRGLELALPGIAAHYGDVSSVLREGQAEAYESANDVVRRRLEEVLWRKSDPLYLTAENEVRVAHLARVAYADLMFEDPSEGLWGSETEQGVIYVRYGPPQRIWQLRRDAEREQSEQDVRDALTVAEVRTVGYGTCPSVGPCYASDPISIRGINTKAKGGGRWILWNYDWDQPNFIFQKQSLRWRHVRHQPDSYAKFWEEELRESQPALYTTNFDVHGYPAQLARFKGTESGIIELDLYSEVPTGELLGEIRADSLELGVFVFTDPQYSRILERRLRLAAQGDRQAVTYTIPLGAGRYALSLEARASHGAAAVRRAEIELEPFAVGELALSDLVLAHSVAPRSGTPLDRRDFAMLVERRLEFEAYEPLALYWEVYGLTSDDEGFAHYQVTVSVTDIEGGGVLAKVAGALGSLLGLSGDPEPELSFERVVELTGDRVPEHILLEHAIEEPGEYRVRIQVNDRLSGATVARERVFQVRGS